MDKLEGASYEERFVIDFASEPRGRTGACSATAGCDQVLGRLNALLRWHVIEMQVHLASNIGCRAPCLQLCLPLGKAIDAKRNHHRVQAKNQCNGDATELVWQNGSAHA